MRPNLRQLREYSEGQATLQWESITFHPTQKQRRRIEPRTFWTVDAVTQFMDSTEWQKYDRVTVLLSGYRNQKTCDVEFYHEKTMFVVDGMIVWTHLPRPIDS